MTKVPNRKMCYNITCLTRSFITTGAMFIAHCMCDCAIAPPHQLARDKARLRLKTKPLLPWLCLLWMIISNECLYRVHTRTVWLIWSEVQWLIKMNQTLTSVHLYACTHFEQKDIADVVKELSEEASEDSSDNFSDMRNTENNTSGSSKEGSRGRWKRRGTSLSYLTNDS